MSRKIVLAIDDDPVQLDLFKMTLGANYDVRVVESASSALKYLNEDKADVILLDIGMPNICGFQFLSDIRKIISYFDVPIIIVSGHTGKEFFDEARSSSAFDVLTKPVKVETLIKTIEAALRTTGTGVL